MRIKLWHKLLGYSIALAILPLGVASRSMLRITQDELKDSANTSVGATAERLVTEIDALYRDTWVAPLRLVANGVDSPSLEPPEKVALLNAGIANITDVVACQLSVEGLGPAVIIREAARDQLAKAGLDPSQTLTVPVATVRELRQRAQAGAAASEPFYVPQTDQWLLTIAIPLANPIAGQPATLSAQVDLERLRTLVEVHPFDKTVTLMLVDRQGHRLFDRYQTDMKSLPIVADALERMAAGSRAIAIRPYQRPEGQRVLAALAMPQFLDWAAIVELPEASAYAVVQKMIANLRLWVLIGMAIAVVGGFVFARGISRPVEEVARAARAVGKGHLDVQVKERGTRDEIGALSKGMNEMIRGLRERDFIRETFGRYVSPEVAQKVLSDPAALHPGGELRTVTVMFSDLRGFTSMSEQLTPPQMVEILNSYLSRMSDVIARHDGTVIEFIGDAIMTLFGAPTARPDDPLRAIACAAEMQIELERFNEEVAKRGVPPLQQGVGISTGSVIVGNIGSEKRMKYGVVGDDVNLAARAESFTVGGEVIVAESTYHAVGDQVEFRGPIEVKAKGKKEPMRLYAVVTVGGTYDLRVPYEHRVTEPLTAVSVPVDCFKLVGKAVVDTVIAGRIAELGADHAVLLMAAELKALDDLKLTARPAGQPPIDEIYAKVQQAEAAGPEWRCVIRFTSMPLADRPRFRALAGIV